MGGKSSSKKEVVAEPAPQSSFNAEAYMGPVMQMLAAQQQGMQEAMMQTQALQANMYASVPQTTTAIKVDYDAENKALQDKLAKQVEAEDSKRKGVLGTILTSLDDEEPKTVKSLLKGESDGKV